MKSERMIKRTVAILILVLVLTFGMTNIASAYTPISIVSPCWTGTCLFNEDVDGKITWTVISSTVYPIRPPLYGPCMIGSRMNGPVYICNFDIENGQIVQYEEL